MCVGMLENIQRDSGGTKLNENYCNISGNLMRITHFSGSTMEVELVQRQTHTHT